jgi:hypothetical protein
MKDKPQPIKTVIDEDLIEQVTETKEVHRDYRAEREEEQLYDEMRQSEEMLAFCQDVVEEIKTLTEYHVIPVAEYLTSDRIESFVHRMHQIN